MSGSAFLPVPPFDCWCGAKAVTVDPATLERGCGGLGFRACYCGGDSLCVCHFHGGDDCDLYDGCEDCRVVYDPYYSLDDGGAS